MADQLLLASATLVAIAALSGLCRGGAIGRVALVLGAAAGVAASVAGLLDPPPAVTLPLQLAGEPVSFRMEPGALWLFGFGLVPATLACALTPSVRRGDDGWTLGAAMSLGGSLGVFGLENGAAMLIAWELMSLGGAVMLLSEGAGASRSRAVLFMLALLEVGAVALLVAIAILATNAGGLGFADFAAATARLSAASQVAVGILLLVGFGAKLGILPFYEWFPEAYASGSGSSGAIMSGVVLNAAFHALSRGLGAWLPPAGVAIPGVALVVIVAATFSAILAILYAFQQEDWRSLLSLSTAENASVAVVALGAATLFGSYRLDELAGLALTVALLHLAAHSLAKGALFLAADGLREGTGSYRIVASGAGGQWVFSLGAVLAAMSLAALPPTAGFASEWFVFQSVFQGFHLPTLAGRLALAMAGAGLALTAAIALATCVKIAGLALLGRKAERPRPVARAHAAAVGALGLGVLLLGVGMPLWLQALSGQAGPTGAAAHMRDGPLLVPLSAGFAFISPSLLVVATPAMALLPAALLLVARRRPVRRTAVWYGGLAADRERAATTALTFSNALRTFYSFVYRPTARIERDADDGGYFVRRLSFAHDVAPVFGPLLFEPSVRAVRGLAAALRPLQSGHLNFYLGLIGVLLVLVLGLTLL